MSAPWRVSLGKRGAPAHFGALWPWLVAAKQRFDRRRVLAPHQQIFTNATTAP